MVNKSKKVKNLFNLSSDSGKEPPLCGIDEAGRGPLAGPLVMAGVVLLRRINGLGDSKKLDEKKRETLYERIIQRSRYHLIVIDNETIDRDGISRCLREGLREIRRVFAGEELRFLFDGNSSYGVSGIATLVKADASIREVSAASILAKVTRDRIMLRYAEEFPHYGFEHHKGYGTREHLDAIEKYGYCPIHRRSFRIKKMQEGRGLFDEH